MKFPRQNGFTIVSAIFILVVLAALGAFMVTVSTTQQIGSALDVQGSRAYQAARSGIEWGVFQVQATPAYNFGHASVDPNTRGCPASPTSFSFPVTAATLTGFTVTVTCVATVDPRGLGAPIIFTVTATACNQPVAGTCPNTSMGPTAPNSFYIERRLDVAF
ncbi:MAG: hypothetical protein WC073_08680 [Sterolibacterium sp.]